MTHSEHQCVACGTDYATRPCPKCFPAESKVIEMPFARSLTPEEIAPESVQKLDVIADQLRTGYVDHDDVDWLVTHIRHLHQAMVHFVASGDPVSHGYAGSSPEMGLWNRCLAERAMRGEKLFNDTPPPSVTAICPGCGKGFQTSAPVDPRYKCPKCTFGGFQ